MEERIKQLEEELRKHQAEDIIIREYRKTIQELEEENRKLKERIEELETDYDRLKVAFEDVVSGK